MDNPKKLFQSNIYTSPGISFDGLRSMAKANPKEFVYKIEQLSNERKIKLSDIKDIKALFRMVSDLQVPVKMPDLSGQMREINASVFPILTGTLIIAQINDAYQGYAPVTPALVTDMEDNKKITTVVAIHPLDKEGIDEVKYGKEFPEIGTSEESMTIGYRLNGRKLTMGADVISENNVSGFMDRVNALAYFAFYSNETQTIKRLLDYDGSAATPRAPYVYKPAGSGTTLYSATANTPGIRTPSGNVYQNNAFEDDSDLDNSRARLWGFKDENSRRVYIPWSSVYIMTPTALIGKMMKVFNSQYVPGVENELSNYGPGGTWYIPKERIITSPLIDDYTTSTWLMGDFKSQFRRKWKLRFEYVTLGTDTQAYLNSMVAFQARLAWDMEIGAVDYNRVVMNLSGTTMPADQ